jgi:hypothetical protein
LEVDNLLKFESAPHLCVIPMPLNNQALIEPYKWRHCFYGDDLYVALLFELTSTASNESFNLDNGPMSVSNVRIRNTGYNVMGILMTGLMLHSPYPTDISKATERQATSLRITK